MVNKLLSKTITTDLLSLIGICLLVFFIFSVNRNTLVLFIPSVIITYLVYTYYPKKIIKYIPIEITVALAGALISYFFGNKYIEIGAILIGINITAYYIFQKKETLNFNALALINIIPVTAIIVSSAFQKFRGFNKLDMNDLRLNLPLLVISFIAIFFFIQFINYLKENLSARFRLYLLLIITVIVTTGYFLVSYYVFKEVGYAIIFVPLAAGVITGLISLIDKRGNMIIEIAEIAILIIYPYSVSGLAGIALSLLSLILFKVFVLEPLKYKLNSSQDTALKIAPIIFLLGVTEVREEIGQITRFNLISGFQLGWGIISAIVIKYLYEYLQITKKTILENEVGKYLPVIISVFTILILTLIIRFGRHEALSSMLFVGSIFLFFSSSEAYENQKPRLMFFQSLSYLIGAASFLMLTRI